jgi:hypothetical protein
MAYQWNATGAKHTRHRPLRSTGALQWNATGVKRAG